MTREGATGLIVHLGTGYGEGCRPQGEQDAAVLLRKVGMCKKVLWGTELKCGVGGDIVGAGPVRCCTGSKDVVRRAWQ